jgi:glutamate--cysteine ligase
VVAEWAARRGWRPLGGGHGLPRWSDGQGAVLSYEPGGQLEYASPPSERVDRLLDRTEATLRSLTAALEAGGIEVVARGMDPWTPPDQAVLHLPGERYLRQGAHYDRVGPWGRRMMRQSAALHLNVDPAGVGWEAWHLGNALAPILVATFANSSRLAGEDSGWRSARSAQWRRLDPARTGVFGHDDDPPVAYAQRALAAPAFLLGPSEEPARPFRQWLDEGRVGTGEWRDHLTTFFPEVRARGYLEVRGVDALPLRWVGVPLLLLTGLLRHPTSRRCALELLPPASEAALERAGRAGLGDPEVARLAVETLEMGIAGLRELGSGAVAPRWVDRVEAFADRFTRRGRDPGHDDRDRFV